MKYIIVIIALLFSLNELSAQTYDKPGNYGLQYKRLKADSSLKVPVLTDTVRLSNLAGNGDIIYVQSPTGTPDTGFWVIEKGAYVKMQSGTAVTPNLQNVTDAGNTTTNDIEVAGVYIPSPNKLLIGTQTPIKTITVEDTGIAGIDILSTNSVVQNVFVGTEGSASRYETDNGSVAHIEVFGPSVVDSFIDSANNIYNSMANASFIGMEESAVGGSLYYGTEPATTPIIIRQDSKIQAQWGASNSGLTTYTKIFAKNLSVTGSLSDSILAVNSSNEIVKRPAPSTTAPTLAQVTTSGNTTTNNISVGTVTATTTVRANGTGGDYVETFFSGGNPGVRWFNSGLSDGTIINNGTYLVTNQAFTVTGNLSSTGAISTLTSGLSTGTLGTTKGSLRLWGNTDAWIDFADDGAAQWWHVGSEGSPSGDIVFKSDPSGNATFNGTEKLRITRTTGKLTLYNTVTPGGTTGNVTINRPTGSVNIAAAGTTVTVTNSAVVSTSLVFVELQTNDATAWIKNVVPTTGSFTINLGAASTGEVKIAFWVIN